MALFEIVEAKRQEVAKARKRTSVDELRRGLQPSTRSLEGALRRAGPAFIFECKKASPSKGVMREDYDPVALARAYAPFASAVSVLADEAFFGGSPEHVTAVAKAVDCPVLYKDVVVDEFQVVAARAAGADAVLLMAAVLDDTELEKCRRTAEELGLDVLAEAHDEAELARLVALGFPIVGINNRNLRTLEVDLATVERLSHLVPDDRVLISESGVRSRADVARLARSCDGFLIGGALSSSPDVERAVRELVFGRVKVCGLTRPTDAALAFRLGATDGGVILTKEFDSPRAIDVEQAREILADTPLRKTGVFVGDRVEFVARAARELGLDAVQLHGDESDAYVRQLRTQIGETEIVPVVRVRDGEVALPDGRVLLDTFVPGTPGGTGQTFAIEVLEGLTTADLQTRVGVAGGFGADNVGDVARLAPAVIELNSRVESAPGVKSERRLAAAFEAIRNLPTRSTPEVPDAPAVGRFGAYGGQFVPEILMPALTALDEAFQASKNDPEFDRDLRRLLRDFAGRPTPLYVCDRLAPDSPATIIVKREDLLHGGAHKTNQVLAQALLAQRLGKTRLIAETGAGQHGVATAMVGALFGLETVIYMGAKDVARQQPNVQRMRLMGAEVRAVEAGEGTLKEAINAAMRDWAGSYESTHYLLGTVAGPHPYPTMVRDFQRVIGDEARRQCLDLIGSIPDVAVACVGGGSNAIGLFTAFLDDDVELIGVEPYGEGLHARHGATLGRGRPGVLHGARTMVLQDDHGQIVESHSISAGLDYPAVGPEHAFLQDSGRVRYLGVTDEQALAAFAEMSRCEGIIPALESAHAIAYALELAAAATEPINILVNLSGRGDKDLATVLSQLELP